MSDTNTAASNGDSASPSLEIDFGDWEILEQVADLLVDGQLPDKMQIWIPLPNFGSTQSHLDICGDLLDASYAAESLGANAQGLKIEFDQTDRRSCYKIVLTKPSAGIWDILKQCAILFTGDEDEVTMSWDYDLVYINSLVEEFAENIDTIIPLAPDIIDHYYMNLVHGVYGDSEYEEIAKYGLRKFPERKIGYCRSAVSRILGADCYVSPHRWAVPSGLDLDAFFAAANEKYRLSQFEPTRQHLNGNHVYEFSSNVAIRFTLGDFQNCRSVTEHLLKNRKQKSTTWPPPTPVSGLRKRCLVHETGSAALVDDGIFTHIFYSLKKLGHSETQQFVASLGELAASAAELTGLGRSITLPWSTLSDEQFESLCYDVIWLDPRFDVTTLKKMGKSRSRDGGRDIIVHEKSRSGQRGQKWIFQCKLIRDGSSLTPSKLQNIGDMLEQYGAKGFGIMTSTVIDATLYDRVEAICKNRSIVEGHFSVFELERTLSANQGVKARYFPPAITGLG